MTASSDSTETAEDVRFRTIFEQSPVSTQIFSPDGSTVAANRAWEKLWGVTIDQISGYNILEDSQLIEKGAMPYVLRGFAGEATEIPAIKYEPDRTMEVSGAVPYRWVTASIYPVTDERGTIREIVLMHQDITERRQAEEALRESEERFRAMFDGAPVGISLIDKNGCYVAVNPVRQEMLGCAEAELVGKPYQTLTHPDDVDYDQQVNEEARQVGRDRFQLEKRFIRSNGDVIWSRITAAIVRDELGEIQYTISIAEDITERKRIEEERAQLLELEREARRSIERLAAEREAILGQIAEGIIIADPDGRLTFVNRRAREIHGVAALDVPVEAYSDTYRLFTMSGLPYPPQELPLARAVLKGETVVDAEWIIRRPDGTEVVAQGSATPVTAEDGTRLGAVVTIRDVTAHHELERQKDEFLSAIAHDLRTPLTTIKGRLQILKARADRGDLSETQLVDSLARIESNSSRMVVLINELLDVANIQIGRPFTLIRRPFNLLELTHSVAREHQYSAGRHTISVQSPLPELLGTWDSSRIERVVANLLSNAVKYSPEGGDILVTVDRWDDSGGPWAIICVEDHGVGIPVEDLPFVFERFHRARNVAGTIPGTGIGLAAVHTIVEQHGGAISVESREGVGTKFTVRLPLHLELKSDSKTAE